MEENSSAVSAPSTFDSVADAVAELDRRDTARADARAAEKAAKAAPPEETPASEPDTDAPASESEPDEPGADYDASDEVATDEEQAAEPQERITVNLDGKEIEIPKGTPRPLVDAVKKLESDFRADYTRKTQEVAAERQQVHAAYQQTAQLSQQLQQTQAVLAQFYQQTIGEPPTLELAQTDPQSYLIQREMHAQRVQQFQQLMGHGQQLSAQQQAMLQHQQQQALAAEFEKAVKALPEMADPAKRAQLTQRFVGVISKYGYSAHDIANVGDHRLLLMLRDLEKHHGRQQAAGTVKEKLANVPPRVNKPGTATQDGGRSAKAAQAKQQFMRSGRTLKDVQRYLSQSE